MRALLEELRDVSGTVDDADDFDAVGDGPIENCVVPHRKMSEVRGVLRRARSDLRVLRVEFARLIELDGEAVRSIAALGIEVIENPFQVFLSPLGT